MVFVVKVDRMDDKLHQISGLIELFFPLPKLCKTRHVTFMCQLCSIYFLSSYMTLYAYVQARMVRVRGLSPKATEQDIYDFFSFSGDIENINVQR